MSYSAHALMENRNGLLVDFRVEDATGFAERDTAIDMLRESFVKDRRITVGGDKGYDTADFVRECREINVTPHIAQPAIRDEHRPSTTAPHATPDILSVSENESSSRKSSAG